MNSYPFLDNKVRPVFTTDLADITPHVRGERIIDISHSPLIPAKELREKLEFLHMAGELDGGLPILRHGVLVGLIPAPDLEFALDKLDNEDNSLCLMSTQVRWSGVDGGDDPHDIEENDPTDFTSYIDPVSPQAPGHSRVQLIEFQKSPVALDIHSPMDLVYECFVKLGLRYICVLRDGHFAGMVSNALSTSMCSFWIPNADCVTGAQEGVCEIYQRSGSGATLELDVMLRRLRRGVVDCAAFIDYTSQPLGYVFVIPCIGGTIISLSRHRMNREQLDWH